MAIETNSKKKKGDEVFAYDFPKSEEITINKSDLQIQLDKYKSKIKSSFSIFDIITIISIWIPIITSDFKGFNIFSSEEIRAAYGMFALIITLYITITKIKSWWSNKNISYKPEQMAKYILDQCNKKNK